MSRKNLTNMYMSTLCLEISMLLQAGVTINNGIMMMLDDDPNKDTKIILQKLLDELENGIPLSSAMRKIDYFPAYMVNMVEIGEKTGRLSETLKALAEHYERQERLSISIKNAILYPSALLAMMIVVVIILIVQVLPIFNDVFGRLGSQMSAVAIRLMQFGAWFRGASVVIASVAFALFALVFLSWLIPGIREGISKAFKNKYGNSGVFGRVANSQFVSSMAIAMSSGLSIDDSIAMAASLNASSKAINDKYVKCSSLINSGAKLSDALRDSEILSARDSRMLSLGGQSGMADAAMAEIARRSDRSVQDEISQIVSRIEPTLVIITSVIVGVILLSVMLPLMGIMTTIG